MNRNRRGRRFIRTGTYGANGKLDRKPQLLQAENVEKKTAGAGELTSLR
jgi:hypothetical protein